MRVDSYWVRGQSVARSRTPLAYSTRPHRCRRRLLPTYYSPASVHPLARRTSHPSQYQCEAPLPRSGESHRCTLPQTQQCVAITTRVCVCMCVCVCVYVLWAVSGSIEEVGGWRKSDLISTFASLSSKVHPHIHARKHIRSLYPTPPTRLNTQ